MHRYLVAALALALVASVFAQQEQEPPVVDVPEAASDVEVAPPADEETADAAGSAEEAIDPDLFEDEALDEQTYEEDEDVFVPTEEIPADEPIPFPTDI